jgi:hypothetical protein
MKLFGRFKRLDEVSDPSVFAGKILAIYSNSEERGGLFQDARLVRIGFNEFVVGRRVVSEPLQDRWSKVTIWIAIHDIAQMMIFDDVEAAKRAFQSDEADDSKQGDK